MDWGEGNGSGLSGSATQITDVAQFAGRQFAFSAWLASRYRPTAPDTDYAIVSLEFFGGAEATGDPLGTILFDGNDQQSAHIVGSMNIDGLPDPTIAATQDNWTLYRAQGVVPEMAASAAVVIRSANVSSVGDDAYVDLVSQQVVPEPTSASTLALGILVLAISRRMKRRAAAYGQ
jgi:hypothetical protein